jgi:peptidyl-prolyl cis-trans isomerase D
MRFYPLCCILLLLTGCFSGPGVYAGKVNGQPVSQDAYNARIRQKFETYRIKNGASPDESTMNTIRDDAWNDVVRNVVLQQAYRKHQITVSTSEVMDSLRNRIPPEISALPIFNEEGRFDRAKYLTSLETGKPVDLTWLKAHYFNAYIPYCKLRAVIGAQAPVREADLQAEYRYRFGSSDVRFVQFPMDKFAPPVISNPEIQEFYRAHHDEFARAPECDFDYVVLTLQPSPVDEKHAERKIDSLWSVLLKGGDFETLVRRFSMSATANEKGDLGFVETTNLPDSLVKQLDNPSSPGFTSPIRIPEGWRILQLVSRTRTLMKLREIVILPEISTATMAASTDKAVEIRELAASIGLERAAGEYRLHCEHIRGLAAGTTDIPGLGRAGSLVNRVLNANPGELLEPISNPRMGGILLVQVKSVQTGEEVPLVDCADSIRVRLEKSARMELARATVIDWSRRYDATTLVPAAENAGYPVIELPGLTASTPLAFAESDSLQRFVLGEKSIGMISTPLRYKGGWALAVVVARRNPITPTYENARPLLVNQIHHDQAEVYFMSWLEKSIQKAHARRFKTKEQPKPVSVKQMPLSEDAFDNLYKS